MLLDQGRLAAPSSQVPKVNVHGHSVQSGTATEAFNTLSIKILRASWRNQKYELQGSVGSIGEAMTIAIGRDNHGLYKAEVIGSTMGPCERQKDVEFATLDWGPWSIIGTFRFGPIGYIAPAQAVKELRMDSLILGYSCRRIGN